MHRDKQTQLQMELVLILGTNRQAVNRINKTDNKAIMQKAMLQQSSLIKPVRMQQIQHNRNRQIPNKVVRKVKRR